MLQAFQITLTDEKTGPRGGKALPLRRAYSVTAETPTDALEIFKEEMPGQIAEKTQVTVSGWGCRVTPLPV